MLNRAIILILVGASCSRTMESANETYDMVSSSTTSVSTSFYTTEEITSFYTTIYTTDFYGTGSGGGSSGKLPICGNGIPEEDEECDDGNLENTDGCNNLCGRDRIIFVTSKSFTPKTLNGLFHADELCLQLAGHMDFPNAVTYKAWLSDSELNAVDRLYHGKGYYKLVNGDIVADNFNDLLDGQLYHAIYLTEEGNEMNELVWTGTNIDGTNTAPYNCNDWTSDDWELKGIWGDSKASNQNWTNYQDQIVNPVPCIESLPIYCIEGE